MGRKTVTVLLSTYNGEMYLKEQLDSLRNQSRVIDEVIIKDDFSSDDTCKIIVNYLKENRLTNWRFLKNDRNLGWKENFVSLVMYVKTDYFMFCDQDDIWHLNKVERMMEAVEANQKIEVLASEFHAFYEDRSDYHFKCKYYEKGKIIRYNGRNNFLLNEYPGCACCISNVFVDLYKKLWCKEIPHDAFAICIAIMRNSFYTIGEELIDYRRHNGTATNHRLSDRRSRILQTQEHQRLLEICMDAQEYDLQADDLKIRLKSIQQWIQNRRSWLLSKSVRSMIANLRFLKYYWSPNTYIMDIVVVLMDYHKPNKI